MEHLRGAVRVHKVEIGLDETSREDISSLLRLVMRKVPPVKGVGATGIHPGVLIKCQRGQIGQQPVPEPGHRDQGKLAVFVSVDDLSRVGPAKPSGRCKLRLGPVIVFESHAAVRQRLRNSPTQCRVNQIRSVNKDNGQASRSYREHTGPSVLSSASEALYGPAQ